MEFSSQWWMLAIGFVGQGFFFMRFFWQWIVSEKEKKSVIPVCFWYFSLFGSFFLLTYAILRRDIVFIVGQSTGFYHLYAQSVSHPSRTQQVAKSRVDRKQAAGHSQTGGPSRQDVHRKMLAQINSRIAD